jgi:hypothetical protein
MKIQFESSSKPYGFPFRIIGSAGRYDTITDCAFLNDTHIVCADRQMATLYLVQFDLSANMHTILDTKLCISSSGRPQHFDLIDIHKNIIYGVTFDDTLFVCKINLNKFSDIKIYTIHPSHTYHGLCMHYSNKNIVYTTNTTTPTIIEYNTEINSKTTHTIPQAKRIKDVAIIDSTYLLVLSTEGGPRNTTESQSKQISKPYNSHVLVYDQTTSKTIKVHTLIDTHIDSCVYIYPYCYVTCTTQTGEGYILKSKLDGQYNFTDITEIPCAKFPHGITYYKNLLAYTSYGESSVYIYTLEEFNNKL